MLSPIIPITHGIKPKPATPKTARRTIRIVASVSRSSAATERMFGQKHAVAIPAKKSRTAKRIRFVMNVTKIVINKPKKEDQIIKILGLNLLDNLAARKRPKAIPHQKTTTAKAPALGKSCKYIST